MPGNGGGRGGNSRRANGRRLPAYLLDVSPYLATGLLGAWICWHVHWSLAVVELAATVLGPLWIMVRVCPTCFLYGKEACPSGFGLASARMVDRGDPDRFGDVFSLHIIAVVPMWFVPIAAIAYLMVTGNTAPWPLVVAFLAVAFVVVPLKARYVTCAKCPKRAECPWGSRTALPSSGRRI